jgi:MFS family permease
LTTPTSGSAIREILSRKTLPVFSAFFFWSFGTGGLWLVRPLFAYEIGGTFLLVALISSASAMPRVIIGPVTGYLTDRFGRRPFVILGASLHIAALTGDFFVQEYWQFLLFEIVAGTGIAVYMTSANVLMADATRTGTRGRAIAARQVSNRIGNLAGPIVAGLIAAVFGLRYVFLFIAVTKFIVILVALFFIKEQREPAAPKAPKPLEPDGERPSRMPDLSMFKSRTFLSLALGTVALGLVNGGTGVFRTLFPPQAGIVAGLSEAEIGYLIALAGLAGLLSSVPSGIAVDRFGRKRPLIVGLLATALGTYFMAITGDFGAALLAVVVFGLAESLGQGSLQTYAMDQAPADKRGAFLGMWLLFTNVGQITGPLVIGTIADIYGFKTGFITVVIALIIAAGLMGLIGKDTRAQARGQETPNAPNTAKDS